MSEEHMQKEEEYQLLKHAQALSLEFSPLFVSTCAPQTFILILSKITGFWCFAEPYRCIWKLSLF